MNDSRRPPHDLDAEAAVLSAVMIGGTTGEDSPIDLIADVLQPEQFYSEAHRQIYAAALELRAVGKPVDIVQIATWLKDRERIGQVGGMGYLTEVLNAAPAIANVRSYAATVRDKWRVRRLIATCQRIAAQGYLDYGEASKFLEQSEADVRDVAQIEMDRTGEPIGLATKRLLVDVAEALRTGNTMRGVATGFTGLDRRMRGLRGSTVTIVAARPGMGKAHPLSTSVLTPSGWTQIGDLSVGDLVIGSDGKATAVTGVHDRGTLDVYRVVLEDGSSVRCCGDHLWATRTRSERKAGKSATAKSTDSIAASIRTGGERRLNHSIQYVRPVEFGDGSDAFLILDPYVMGCLLGDGEFGKMVRFTSADPDVVDRVAEGLPKEDTIVASDYYGFRIKRKQRNNELSETAKAILAFDLSGKDCSDKFLPAEYWTASIRQRLEVLRGLFDTDGYVTDPQGSCIEYATASERLKDAVVHLVGSLGGRCTWSLKQTTFTKDGDRKPGLPSYRVVASFPQREFVPLSCARKVAKYQAAGARNMGRFIVDVRSDGKDTCRCITVAAADHLYVTENFMVTHNSAFALNMAMNIARSTGGYVPFFSLEMNNDEQAARSVSSEAGVPLSALTGGDVSNLTVSKIVSMLDTYRGVNLILYDESSLTPQGLGAKVRNLIAKAKRAGRGVSAVFVDYLQLMKSSRRTNSREQEVADVSRSIKLLAKETKIPFVVLAQLNRDGERGTKPERPKLSQLRESGSIEQDADNVIFIHRDAYYTQTNKPTDDDVAELIIAKGRNMSRGTTKVRFDGTYTKFDTTEIDEER